ncbi:putative ABC transport system permease protein [Bifidobacterium bohemicum]|uniref:ABC transporter ATP-binding protein n=1 Tax=Bifidobacterium bohemicum DSM 22767 TaxID=1437606 RepID=A0A086ZGL3_9BIFI|nr:ABC transporter ATP-binding protein/permease [Bifidobacterium bohemicum]KFI45663.1 ABC transporter ATP-binding protein [Bifidobacterium bohemicum DSM 22767]SCB99287.1 putative ABC transport system permease protein [Bifidobacterium bohemicum]
MLQIKDISKQYKTGDFVQRALDDVSLTLRDNEFVAILGPSGSGKTTLLNIIGGLDRYDQGDLVINGISTKQYKDRDWDSYRNHTVGFVFQSYNLIPHQSVLSNVELALTISGVSRVDRRRRATEALNKVGLGEHINKKPNQLSGGQMQRVAIARALVNDPRIVLADEPTGALDSETSVQIMDLLREVAKDRLVVMVTHNPELAYEYANRIVELKDGVIRSDSRPVEREETGDETAAMHRRMGKASMSFATSVALSFNNLRSKKARTILTSFAGSIGIIGIALILSVSTGVNRYITDIQKETLTSYPIEINEQTFDMNKILDTAQATADSKEHAKPRNGIYPDDSSIKGAASLTNGIASNNLSPFKQYLDKPGNEVRAHVGDVGIQYSYAPKFSVFTHDAKGTLVDVDGVKVGGSSVTTESGASTLAGLDSSSNDIGHFQSLQISKLTGKADNNKAPAAFAEIMPGRHPDKQPISSVITDNYQVVKGHWPKSSDQVVLVLDKSNQIPLAQIYELGLLPSADYNDMMNRLQSGEKVKTNTDRIDYAKAMDQPLTLLPAADQYVKDGDGRYRYVGDDATEVGKLMDSPNAMKLHVVGVIRANEDAKTTPLTPGIGYTRMLTDELIAHADSSQIVASQKADRTRNILNGMTFAPSDDSTKAANAKAYVASLSVSQQASMAKNIMTQTPGGMGAAGPSQPADVTAQRNSAAGAAGNPAAAANPQNAASGMGEQQTADAFNRYLATAPENVLVSIYNQYVSTGTYDGNLADFGVIGRDAPSSIKIYADSFEAKNAIEDAIRKYNDGAKKKDRIVYTDYAGLMMNSVTTIINVITYVLSAFVGVSLVVSSIMIGIITYISVLERTKEIGILRAMGASKRNVSTVFNAETGIIGLCAGLIGIAVTLLLIVPGNAVMHHFMGTNRVNAMLPVSGAIILIVLSVVLTLIGGLIPSRKAARQDPATALRTE